MSAELFCMWRTADNSGHTATLRSAQIQPNGWTSHVRNTLSEIVSLKTNKKLKKIKGMVIR